MKSELLSGKVVVFNGDCLEVVKTLPDNSIDSIVTDPPYHLNSIVKRFGKEGSAAAQYGKDGAFSRASKGFMGKEWDGGDIAFRPETWAEFMRVLKPGGHMVAFAASKNAHRMITAIEDAGFEIRDTIMYIYGSGFPKGLSIDKEIYKKIKTCLSKNNALYAEQISKPFLLKSSTVVETIVAAFVQVIPEKKPALIIQIGGEENSNVQMAILPLELVMENTNWNIDKLCQIMSEDNLQLGNMFITETTTNLTIDSKTLKFLLSKITPDCTIKDVTIQHGLQCPVGIVVLNSNGEKKNMNVIPTLTALGNATSNPLIRLKGHNICLKPAYEPICLARKPLEGTVVENVLKHGVGGININDCRVDNKNGRYPANVIHDGSDEVLDAFPKSKDGVAVNRNRDPNLDMGNKVYGEYKKPAGKDVGYGGSGSAARFFYSAKATKKDRKNSKHPTVKPINLMRYLCNLITPNGGTILDPFAGSGSTGEAAYLENFNVVLIEREKEYYQDIIKRFDEYGDTIDFI